MRPARIGKRPAHWASTPSPATMHGPPEHFVKPADTPPPVAHPVQLILTLSLAAMVGIGIGRLAYALVLPDLRDSLHWSYSVAGFMNTVKAAGYLAGALMASQLIRRFGWSGAIIGGTLACLASLAVCDDRQLYHAKPRAADHRARSRNRTCRGRRARRQYRANAEPVSRVAGAGRRGGSGSGDVEVEVVDGVNARLRAMPTVYPIDCHKRLAGFALPPSAVFVALGTAAAARQRKLPRVSSR